MSALERITSFTNVFTVCLDSQCAEDLFTAGLDMEDDCSELEHEQLPAKERLNNAKEKFELSNHSVSQLRTVFDSLKKTKTGALEISELKNAFYFWKILLTDGELKRIIEENDEIDSSEIEFPEFIVIIEEKRHAIKLENEYAGNFQKHDTGNGFISEKNLIKCLKEFDNLDLDDDELHHLTLMVNKNGNGDLNFNDYVKVLRFRDILA